MRILQVCNAGRIGGTAACAWTVTRAFPEAEHVVAFRSAVGADVRELFGGCRVLRRSRIERSFVREVDPDVILLHNTRAGDVETALPAPHIQYVHSQGMRAVAEATVYCSRWLANRCGDPGGEVLLQGVPRPPPPLSGYGDSRGLREELVIGRICTPTAGKWPAATIDLTRRIAERYPRVSWEFVGCPASLQARLHAACGGRARFHEAGWSARRLLWTWDAMLYSHPRITESFGRTVAESLRAGCIPIVDARGGFLEQVAEGCGFLCATEDDFLRAVDMLYGGCGGGSGGGGGGGGGGLRRRMSRRAREHGDRCFSIERFRHDLRRVFRRAAA